MDERLPAHLEVSALIRRTQAEGGFATVLQRGEREAGTIMIVVCENGTNSRTYERMPGVEGGRKWHRTRAQDSDNKDEFEAYLTRRGEQDRDLWIIELDVAQGERLIGLTDQSS